MGGWIKRWRDQRTLSRRPIPDALWKSTLEQFEFLQWRSTADLMRLRELTTLFLADKEFTGAHGLKVDDRMAVAIAAQACLLVIRLGLEWFADFKGIVVQPDVVRVRRESVDEAGVVHAFDEELSGEAMQGGPLMLSWRDVSEAGRTADDGYNVVVHEFAHVMDLRQGAANGIPPLANDRLRRHWVQTLHAARARFCRQIERGQETVLDPYAATSPEEFFAVACEAFFVAPLDLQFEHPAMYDLLASFFQQDPAAAAMSRSGGGALPDSF